LSLEQYGDDSQFSNAFSATDHYQGF